MSSLNVADPEVHASNARKLLTAQAALALLACLSASEFAAWAAAQLALALWALSSFELGREDARALYCIATPLRWLLDAVWYANLRARRSRKPQCPRPRARAPRVSAAAASALTHSFGHL